MNTIWNEDQPQIKQIEAALKQINEKHNIRLSLQFDMGGGFGPRRYYIIRFLEKNPLGGFNWVWIKTNTPLTELVMFVEGLARGVGLNESGAVV